MLKTLPRDPVIRLTLGVWAILTLLYVVPVLPPSWLATYSQAYLDLPLVPLVIAACWVGLGAIEDEHERRFWQWWGASFVTWLAISLPFAVIPGRSWTIGWMLYGDIAYLVMYLCFILAIEMRPHREHTGSFNEREQQLRAIGFAVLAFFGLVYFVLVSATFDVDRYESGVPSMYLFIALDLAVFARLLWLRRETWSVRWAMIYSWLAAGSGLMLAGDIVEVLYRRAGVAIPTATLLDQLWIVPLVLFALGIRSRQVSYPPEQRVLNQTLTVPEPLRAGHVLMVSAFSLPLVHYLIDAGGLLDRTTEPLREVVATASMIVLGGMALVAYRILERERLQIEARQLRLVGELGIARKMDAVARLAAAVAHDFNNLIQVIRGRSDIIADQIDEGDPMQEDIREIRAAAARATDLASELMAFGRTQPSSPATVSLHDLLRRSGQLLRPLLNDQTRIDFKLRARVDVVRVDPLQFERVILNLGTNARDAMPEGGTLTFTTENPPVGVYEGHPYADRSRVMLSVADSGAGMTLEIMEHIFEPFFTTKEERGSGLGLAIVHGLVQQFGGTIAVESVPGEGTTFTIQLPVVEGSALPVSRLHGTPATPDAVLVIDTDPTNRQLLRRLLTDLDLPILTSASADEAQQVVARYPGAIGLAVVDVTSDGGRTVVGVLREQYPDLKAVLLAQDQPIDIGEQDMILREPFELSDVLNATRRLLGLATAEELKS